ncbi:MAG: class I SAM-dependent methyltransferase [Deltaproteobacteria bacterium]|nr:class I SAM-dependent methyltransferase [Deltaproteobacteria bacterium]
MERLIENACWICGSLQSQPWKPRNLDRELVPDDLKITDARYGLTLSLVRCPDCGFIFAEGGELAKLLSLYEELEDSGYEEGQESRRLQMSWLLKVLRKAAPEAKTLLDIGAGAGALIAEANLRGWKTEGVEPSQALVATAQRLHSVGILQGTYPHPKLSGHRFDAVCLIDVIEHVPDPVALLRACAEGMESNGRLMVVTPDVGSLAAKILRHRWWHFRLAHVGYFDRRSLDRAAQAAGLHPIGFRRARWFFPVGYVAERLERYLPVGFVNRMAKRIAPLAWLYERVIPVNPRDSMVVLYARQP